ncbi:PREDICTED: uncharacterized protein LOC109129861 [Camelina sativa]|uniref:Uncharacterized protein LOC109129861 n=1 Tax=Camelina sativa TaxID=90675 RepID=A0ABM1R5U1_CAMSA|nr:PREDICTED: uncharacterized protein LOC109129861 [Camelina sativa]
MAISILGWCFIVAVILILAALSSVCGERTSETKTKEENVEKKDPVKKDDKSKTNEKDDKSKAKGDNLV